MEQNREDSDLHQHVKKDRDGEDQKYRVEVKFQPVDHYHVDWANQQHWSPHLPASRHWSVYVCGSIRSNSMDPFDCHLKRRRRRSDACRMKTRSTRQRTESKMNLTTIFSCRFSFHNMRALFQRMLRRVCGGMRVEMFVDWMTSWHILALRTSQLNSPNDVKSGERLRVKLKRKAYLLICQTDKEEKTLLCLKNESNER